MTRSTTVLGVMSILATASAIDGQMVFPDSRYEFGKPGFVLLGDTQRHSYHTPETSSSNLYINSIIGNAIRRSNGIYRGLDAFTLNLNRAILNRLPELPQENVVLSPLSLAGALSMLLLGSVGKTYDELAYALGFFNDFSKSKYVHREFGNLLNRITKRPSTFNNNQQNISYASAVFLQNDYAIHPQYADDVINTYKSSAIKVDFENYPENALWAINRWVSDQTFGKIRNILQTVPPRDTKLILASALYFRAEWERYFIEGLTKRSIFTPDKRYPEENIEVDMMGNEGHFPFYKSKELECTIVGLPYKGNRTTLYAIKPTDSTKRTLRQILASLTAESLQALIQNARRQATIVLFPRMKLVSAYGLRAVLEDMGVRAAFRSGEADFGLMAGRKQQSERIDDGGDDRLVFSGRTRRQATAEEGYATNPGLFVDEVVHKVDIDITETGTEAAASTVVLITKDGRRPVFVADEPFFFLIRDEDTGLTLFSSIVYKPEPNH